MSNSTNPSRPFDQYRDRLRDRRMRFGFGVAKDRLHVLADEVEKQAAAKPASQKQVVDPREARIQEAKRTGLFEPLRKLHNIEGEAYGVSMDEAGKITQAQPGRTSDQQPQAQTPTRKTRAQEPAAEEEIATEPTLKQSAAAMAKAEKRNLQAGSSAYADAKARATELAKSARARSKPLRSTYDEVSKSVTKMKEEASKGGTVNPEEMAKAEARLKLLEPSVKASEDLAAKLEGEAEAVGAKEDDFKRQEADEEERIGIRQARREAGLPDEDESGFAKNQYGSSMAPDASGKLRRVDPVSISASRVMKDRRKLLETLPEDTRLNALRDLDARETDPAAWESAKIEAIKGIPDAELANVVQTYPLVLQRAQASLSEVVAQREKRMTDRQAELDKLATDNTQLVQSKGFTASQLVRTEDGQTWHKAYFERKARIEAEEAKDDADTQAELAAEQAEYDRDVRVHNARVQELNARATAANQKAEAAREQELSNKVADMRASGLHAQSEAFQRITADLKARKEEVMKRYPQGGAEFDAAMKAINADAEQASKMMQGDIANTVEAGRQLYEQWGKGLGYDWSDPQAVEDLMPRIEAEAKKRGMDPRDALYWLTMNDAMDWTKTSNQEVAAAELRGKTGGGIYDHKAKQAAYRVLPNGNLTVDPGLILDVEAYENAVKSSNVTKEAQQLALEARKEAAPQLAESAWKIVSKDEKVKAWADKKFPNGTAQEKMEAIIKEAKSGGAIQMAMSKFASGLNNIGVGWTGALAALTGSDVFTQDKTPSVLSSAYWKGQVEADEAIAGYAEKNTNAITSFLAKAAGVIPSVAEALVAGSATTGAMKYLLLPKGAAGAKAFKKLQEGAGVAGSSLDAGIQSLGGTYVDAYNKAIEQEFGKLSFDSETPPTKEQIEMVKVKARDAALRPALLSGLSTAVITALGGAGGIESVFKAGNTKSITDAIKGVLTRKAANIGLEGGQEFIEEYADQLAQGVIAASTYDDTKSPQKIFDEAIEAGMLGFVAGAGVTGAREAISEWSNRPESKAALDAQINSWQGVPGMEPEAVQAMKTKAATLAKIAQGAEVSNLTAAELESIGWTPQGKPGKGSAVYERNGKLVIRDEALNEVAAAFPSFNDLGLLSEEERLAQIGGTGEESAPEAAPESELSKPDTSKGAVEGATPTPNAEQAQQSGSVNKGQDGEANLAGNAPQGVPAQAAKGLSQVDQGNIAAGGAAAAESVVDQKAHTAATSLTNDLPQPSEAQKQAGNYKMGHLEVGGVAITIENPDGSQRTWKNEDTGEAGSSTIHGHYGYMKNTVGADGDHIDVNIKTGTPEDWSGTVFVIKQLKSDGKTFDEHKVYIGYESEAQAKAAYKSNYQKGWKGYGGAIPVQMKDLANMVKSGKLKKSPTKQPNDQPSSSTGSQGNVQPGAEVSRPATSPEEGQKAQAAQPDAGAGQGGEVVQQPSPADNGQDGRESADQVARVWSIKTRSGKRIEIPADQAKTRGEAIEIMASMAERGDMVNPRTLEEPAPAPVATPTPAPQAAPRTESAKAQERAAPAPAKPTNAQELLKSYPQGSELVELNNDGVKAATARIQALVDELVSKAPAPVRGFLSMVSNELAKSVVPYLAKRTFSHVIIVPGLHNPATAGSGFAYLGGTLIIYPQHAANYATSYSLRKAEITGMPQAETQGMALGIVRAGPLHESAHRAIEDTLTDAEKAALWNSIPDTDDDKRLVLKLYPDPSTPASTLGDEYIRYFIERVYQGKSTEEIYKLAVPHLNNETFMDAIRKVLSRIIELMTGNKQANESDAAYKMRLDAVNRVLARMEQILPQNVKEQAIKDQVTSMGDIDAAAVGGKKGKAESLGNMVRAKNFVNANFAAIADKLGIQLVPSVGILARYIVTDNKTGKRAAYIEYNPFMMSELTPGQVMDVMREEIIHASVDKVLVERVMKERKIDISDPYIQSGQYHKDFYNSIHDLMSPQDRLLLPKVYVSAKDQPGWYQGSEFYRMVIQRELHGGITEQAMAGRKTASQRSKALQAIKKILIAAQDFLLRIAKDKTPAGKQAKDVLDASIKLLKNIEAKQKMVKMMAAPDLPVQTAVKISGKVVLGKPGQTHYDIMANWIKDNELPAYMRSRADAITDALSRITSDWMISHDTRAGFMGNEFMSRAEAWKYLEGLGYQMPYHTVNSRYMDGQMLLDSLDLAEIRAPKMMAAPELPFAPQLGMDYTPSNEGPAADQAKRESSNPLAPQGGIRASTAFGGATTTPALLAWAADSAWLLETDSLAERVGGDGEIPGGDEHDVWHDKATHRAIKLTLDDQFIAGSPQGYIDNLRRQNEEFGAGYAFEGIVNDDGKARIVTSQPWLDGEPATETEIDIFFLDRGYGKVQDGMFYNEKTKTVVGDAKPKNVIRTKDKRTQPFDVQVRTATERQQDRYEDMIEARRRQAMMMASPPLEGLPSKVKIPGMGERVFGPWQKAREVAAAYMEQAGLPYNPPRVYAKVDKSRAERIASAFADMKHEPQNPKVKAAYKALIKETLAQWEAIKATGLKVEPIPAGMPDPYAASPRLSQIDAMENNHLWFFPTDDGFGNNVTGFDPKDNPLFELTGEVINGHKMRANDVFRIVHDYFGHFKEGVGFRADGEENAWRQHAAMFSDEAVAALTSETRGQNSWLNFGPFGEKNRTAKTGETVFADQKIGIMPEWTWKEGSGDEMTNAYAQEAVANLHKLGADEEGGDTMNIDGSKYTQGGVAIPVLSKNFDDYKKLTVADIATFINPENVAYVAAGGAVLKAGIYKFPNSTQASIDLNIIAPRELRAEGVEIAGGLGQESVFDLDTFENVKTGADGKNPRRPTVEEVKDIASRLSVKMMAAPEQDKSIPKDSQGRILAPNGKPSNLTEEQWKVVRTPKFKKWFGDWEKWHNGKDGNGVWNDANGEVSKIVDENGEPMVMFHGSQHAGYSEFEMEKSRRGIPPSAFFSNIRRVAASYSGTMGAAKYGRDLPEDFAVGAKVMNTSGRMSDRWDVVVFADGTEELVDKGLSEADAISQALQSVREEAAKNYSAHRGIYEVFLNIRNPHEEHFEGANWDGSRYGQYVVWTNDEREEMVYSKDGKGYFNDRDEAEALAAQHDGAVVDDAPDMRTTTNGVVKDAERYKNDGAIIHDVIDSGGEAPADIVSDVVVAFDPNQIKSAVDNNGEFSVRDNRIMFMAAPQDELNLGKRGDKEAMRQRNVKRIIASTAESHPEALKVEYVKNGKNYRLDEKGLPQAVPQEYDLLDSRLAKESAKGIRGESRRGAYISALADRIVGMFNGIKDQPDIMAGKEWYRVAREKLRAKFGDRTTMFAQLLAATSARTPVKQNFEQALDAYNGIFYDGRFTDLAERYMVAMANMEAGLLRFRSSVGRGKMGDIVTPQNFRDYLDSEGILPRRENGKKYNANSLQVLNVIAGVWREKLGGPKTAQFSDNLTGASLEATIDVWAARTLHRLSNEHEGRWRILPEAETGVNNEDFAVGQAAFKIAASRLDMNPDDLQGVLWFAEKRVWADRGWTRGAGSELSDFSSLLDYTETVEDGKMVLQLDRNQGMLELDYGQPSTKTNRGPAGAGVQADQAGRPKSKRVRNGDAGVRKSGTVAGRPDGRPGSERRGLEQKPLLMAAPEAEINPGFYSKLTKFVGERMPTKASPKAVLAMIKAPSSGVKPDEIKWSGIQPWLESREGEVSRQEVLDYLSSAGAVRFTEVSRGSATPAMLLDEAINNINKYRTSNGKDELEDGDYAMEVAEKWSRGEVTDKYFESVTDGVADLIRENVTEATKYDQQQLPGGDNYREVVLAMPVSRRGMSDAAAAYYENFVRRGGDPKWADLSEAKRIQIITETPAEAFNEPPEYTSSHFTDIPNYVAHMRVNERVDADGKPGLFIEELQSDRHQQGRKKGYKAKDPSATFDKIQDKYFATANASEVTGPEKNGLFKAAINVGTPDYLAAFGRTADEAKQNLLRHLITKDPEYTEVRDKPISGADERIPDAPFRNSSQWGLALFKRALRDAIASGKDWIGWTVGDTQNDRYDLSKQINRIILQKFDSTRQHLQAFDHDGRRRIDKLIQENELEEYVGKDMAAKLNAMEWTPYSSETSNGSIITQDSKQLSGLDLKVGGEGMRGFYDKIIPNEVGKYVKQWGAAVEKSSINQGGEMEATKFNDFADYMANKGKSVPIWRVDITPSMRENISKQGQPLFMAAPQEEQAPRYTPLDVTVESFDSSGEPLDKYSIPGVSSANVTEDGFIWGLNTDPKERGRGAATAVIGRIIEDRGDSHLGLVAQADGGVNAPDQSRLEKFYSSMGFEPEGKPDAEGQLMIRKPMMMATPSDESNFNSRLVSDMSKTIGDASSPEGLSAMEKVAFAEARQKAEKTPETIDQWERKAKAMIKEDRQAVIDQIIRNYYDGASFGSPELAVAASILQPELFSIALQTGNPEHMKQAQAFAYAASAGATQAGRELRALRNRYRPGRETVKDILSSIYSTIPAKKRGRVAAAPTPMEKQKKIANLQKRIRDLEAKLRSGKGNARELINARKQEKLARDEKDKQQLIEAYTAARRVAVVKALKAEGITEDDIFIGAEERLAAHESDLVKSAIEQHPEAHRDAIGYLMRGYSHEQVSKLTGIDIKTVANIHERFRNVTLKKKVASWVNKGRSVFDMVRQGVEKVFGNIMRMAAPQAWSFIKPKIDVAVANEIERQLSVLLPTASQVNSGKLQASVVKRANGQEVTIYTKFNAEDFSSVYRMARSLSIAEASYFDKLYEYWINNLLSGVMTNVVNLIGNTLSTTIHFLPQRALEIAWNLGGVDASSASLGEVKQIAMGILPGIRQAMANAWMAYNAEADPIRHLYMDEPMQLQFGFQGDIEKIGGYRGPSVGGRSGRVIRIPGRALRAMDALFKTLIMNMEVGAQAYRMARQEIASGNNVNIEQFITQQVNTPGSEAWRKAMEVSENLTFQDSNWLTSVAKTVTQGIDRPAKALKEKAGEMAQKGDKEKAFLLDADAAILTAFAKIMQIVFPFVKTPANILRTGLRKSPLGSVMLMMHMLHAVARGSYNLVNGRPFFKDYPTALLIKSLSEQTQAWAVVSFLLSASEGDDDDDKKDILIVGGRPYGEPGAREAMYRDYGGSYVIIIRKDNGKETRIPFGKYEPVATALGTTIDALRQIKMMNRRSPNGVSSEDASIAIKAIIGDFANQVEDKSFLQGFSTVMREYDAIKRSGDVQGGMIESAKKSMLSALVPNLIRQSIRNTDDIVRDSKKKGEWYDALPFGDNAGPMMDLFGRESKKDEFFPMSRLFLPSANAPQDEHPIEPLIREWNNKNLNPDEQIAPPPMKKSDYYIYAPGGVKTKLETPSDKTTFEKRVGQEFSRRAENLANFLKGKPMPANFKDLIDNIRSEVRREVRQNFVTSPFQMATDRLKNNSQK